MKMATEKSGFTFDVSLRITHPSIDPREIGTKLSLVPHFSYKAGDKRKTPKGNPLPGNFKHSFWFYKLPKKKDASLPKVLKDMNELLRKNSSYLKGLQTNGGKLEYFIGWFSESNSGESLDWELLKECADLRINLAFDVYGPESAPEYPGAH